MRGEGAALGGKDHGAHDIARQEVGRELDSLALDAEGGAEGAHEQGLGEAGHALEQDVAVGEEGEEEAFDDFILADDGAGDFGADFF